MSKINARAKGSRFELEGVRWWKSLGFECATSRLMSRDMDNKCVDLVGTMPFAPQYKSVERSIDTHKILDSMPKDSTDYNLVLHKRKRAGTVVSMTLEDFKELLQMLIASGCIKVGCSGDQIDFLQESGVEI